MSVAHEEHQQHEGHGGHENHEGHGGNKDSAKAVGLELASVAKAAGIETVVFDRNGFKYHGRVKALADAAREGGLVF